MMKKYIFISLVTLFSLVSCSKEGKVTGNPETITVEGAGYVRSVFEEGAVIIYDTEYTVTDIHPYFDGFEMLISGKDAHNSGLITTDIDCIVYMIGISGTTPLGWGKISDSSHQETVMRYNDGEKDIELAIYCKRAFAGVPIEIPVLDSTFPATPLARKIILHE